MSPACHGARRSRSSRPVSMCAELPAPPPAAVPSRARQHARRCGRLAPLVLAVGLTAFLQLRPEPSLGDIGFVPRSWVWIFDSHDFLKNMAGFGGLAAALHLAVGDWRTETWRAAARRAAWLGLLVVSLELAQLGLPERSCDWRDVVAGWIGIALASALWFACARRRS